MPRYRGTTDGAATVVGKLLIAIASGKETSATLSDQLGVSPRQVNRYVLQLVEAGWQIEREGVPTHSDYYFELKSPQIVIGRERNAKKKVSKKRK
jgi:hypothetical protein